MWLSIVTTERFSRKFHKTEGYGGNRGGASGRERPAAVPTNDVKSLAGSGRPKKSETALQCKRGNESKIEKLESSTRNPRE